MLSGQTPHRRPKVPVAAACKVALDKYHASISTCKKAGSLDPGTADQASHELTN